MNHFRKIVIAAVAASTLGAGGLALAARGDGDGSRMVERMERRLELDDSQSAALSVFVEQMQETRALTRGPELREQIDTLLQADTIDQGAAVAMLETRADALRAQAPDLVAAAAAFYDGLDVEQREQIRSFAERGASKSERRGTRN